MVVSDVVQRHQSVKVKVLSFNGQRISLSIKVASTFFVLFYVYFFVIFRYFCRNNVFVATIHFYVL